MGGAEREIEVSPRLSCTLWPYAGQHAVDIADDLDVWGAAWRRVDMAVSPLCGVGLGCLVESEGVTEAVKGAAPEGALAD